MSIPVIGGGVGSWGNNGNEAEENQMVGLSSILYPIIVGLDNYIKQSLLEESKRNRREVRENGNEIIKIVFGLPLY